MIDGEPYGVPWYVDTRVLFYRRDLLPRAGYATMPQTWAEWRRPCARSSASWARTATRIFLPTNEWNPPVIMGLQAGSPLLKDGDTRAAFRDSAFRRGFDFYMSLYREDLAPVGRAATRSRTSTRSSRAATSPCGSPGPWNLGELRNRLPDSLQDAWATAPLPGPDGRRVRRVAGRRLEPGALPRLEAQGGGVGAGRVPVAARRAAALLAAHRRPAGARRGVARHGAHRAIPTCARSASSSRAWSPRPRCRSGSRSRSACRTRSSASCAASRRRTRRMANLSTDVDRMLEKRRWLRGRAPRARGGGRDAVKRATSERRAAGRGAGRSSRPRSCSSASSSSCRCSPGCVLSFTDFDIYAIGAPGHDPLHRPRELPAGARRPRVLARAAQHAVLRGRRRPAVGGGVARRGAAREREGGALEGLLPHRLLRAGRHHAGGGGDRVALPAPPALRAREPARSRASTSRPSTGSAIRTGPCRPSCCSPSGRTSATTCSSSSPACRSIPEELYEAAQLDGAGARRAVPCTSRCPSLAPTFLFVGVMTMIGQFQLFAEPYVMTQGGPLRSHGQRRAAHVRAGLPLVAHGLRRGDRVRAVRRSC